VLQVSSCKEGEWTIFLFQTAAGKMENAVARRKLTWRSCLQAKGKLSNTKNHNTKKSFFRIRITSIVLL